MSDTAEWLSKVKAGRKSAVSFEEEEGDDSMFQGKSSSIVPNLPKRSTKSYSGKDLSGLKVAHDYEAFAAGHSEILVLDDTSVLNADGSEDLLVSANLKDEERIKKRREIARHAKGYSGFKAFEEEAAADEPFTLGVHSRKANILQKYDYSETFNNEPEASKGFVLGEVAKVKSSVEIPVSTTKPSMDTFQNSGTELIDFSKRKSSNKTDLERERKRAKKLTKTLFADEPEMQVDRVEVEQPSLIFQDDEDDSDLQRIISASRKDHLTSNPMVVESAFEPLSIKGKSFDVIFTESISTKESDKPQKFFESQQDVQMTAPLLEQRTMTEDVDAYIGDHDLEPILSEPLVRNGVAATLSLLSMRGISLKPRVYEEEFKSKNQIGADIKLEYFDDFGNKLTSKEAYKELSRRFHGKKAGKSRIEKAIMKREQTNRIEKANASESVIVSNLRKQQAEAGTPYVVLSSTRTQESTPVAPIAAAPGEPVKQRKIFGLQVKK